MPIGGKLKVQFYDTNGYQLDDPWGWKQIMLESLQEQWFKDAMSDPDLLAAVDALATD